MTTTYTKLIQTSVANTYVEYSNITFDSQLIGNFSTLTFFGSSFDVSDQTDFAVIASFPTRFGNSQFIDIDTGVPVNITGNYNVPVYLDGTTVGANYYYPFYQNTSSTANGYFANSTGSFTPTNAKFLTITNGTDNWYRYIDDAKVTSYTGNMGLSILSGTQFVANANTTIQIIPYIRDTVTPNIWVAATTLMTTIDLVANVPIGWNMDVTYFPVDGSVAAGAGMIIRNLVANTRVNIPHAALLTEWIPQ